MGNSCSSVKILACCSDDGTTSQGLQRSPAGLPQSPPTAMPPQSSPIAMPSLQDFIKLFMEMTHTLNIDALIQAIDQFFKSKLNPASTSTTDAPSGSTDLIPNWTSAIGSGTTFLKFVNEHTERIHVKDDFFGSGQGQRVVEEILQQVGQLHWILGGLSIIAYLLNKIEKVSDNRSECLQLLKYMFDLINHITKLKPLLPGEEKKLRDACVLIFEGCITCASQLKSGKFFRFLKSSVDSQTLSNLSSKINRLYQDLNLSTVTEILTTVTEMHTIVTEIQIYQPVVLPLRPPAYPEGAVGLEKPLEELKMKLDLQTTEISPRVLVIYGVGGIGKTTLAKALVATLADDLKNYNYTKVEISEDPLKSDLKSMQQQILRDCFPTYQSGKQILMRDSEEGRDLLKQAFNCQRQKPVFIFIDNALRSKDLKELLPEDLRGFPHCSRILVTTRNLAVTDLFDDRGIPRHAHAVNTLPEEHARQILCKDPTHLNQISNHVKRITQLASGIPLVLQIVGAHLRKQKFKVENCGQILNALEHGGDVKEEDLSERLVHFVYNGLELSTEEAFLDICCFFNGWLRRHVEYIVGVEEVTSLVEAALVTSLPVANSLDEVYSEAIVRVGEERLVVHDVIQAKGRSMAVSTRIKHWSRPAKCQVIKGIVLDDQDIVIEESQLSCLSDSLRILSLGDGIRISGRGNQTFEDLRHLRIGSDSSFFPTNLEGLPCLSVYFGPMFEEVVRKLPQNLKYFNVFDTDVDECPSLKESKSIQAVGNSSLEELVLSSGENMRGMLDGRFHLDALKILDLTGWTKMEELPPQVCGLPSLNKLILRGCRSLTSLPESIANLRALTHLDLYGCEKLEELSSNFGELRALRCLDLSWCESLKKLPDNFGQLSALEYLRLRWCGSLEELPGNFAQLRCLKGLDLGYCTELKEVPPNFVQLPRLQVLWMKGVDKLLPQSGQINNNWKIIY